MSQLTDTLSDLKADDSSVDVSELANIALKHAFDLLDEDSRLEVCELVKEHQENIWTKREERNEANRAISAKRQEQAA